MDYLESRSSRDDVVVTYYLMSREWIQTWCGMPLVCDMPTLATWLWMAPNMAPNMVSSMTPNKAPNMVPNMSPNIVPNMAPTMAPNMAPNMVPTMAP